MTNQERYQAKKAAAHKREMILGLGDNVDVKFQYAGGKTYRLKSTIYEYGEGKTSHSLSVWTGEIFSMNGMNVDKVTDTALKLFTYDMMGTRTTYSMDINKMDFTMGEPEQQPEF